MSGAVISECGRYRYHLWRDLGIDDGREGRVLFVMLNPSTADASDDDPTIRRCISFARGWGYARLDVANLYALRATDPRELAGVDDPIGPDNDDWLERLSWQADVVAAWGAHPAVVARESHVLELLGWPTASPVCLGQTKNLHPRHPLYLRRDARRRPLMRHPVTV